MKDPRAITAQDWSNPTTWKLIHVYPEIPEDGIGGRRVHRMRGVNFDVSRPAEFNFNTNGLKVKEVDVAVTNTFRDTRKALGTRIKNLMIQHLKGKAVWASEQPTQPQLQRMSDLGGLGKWKPALEDIAQYDVVAASSGFIDKQNEKMAAALQHASIPSMQSTFTQVVLLSDKDQLTLYKYLRKSNPAIALSQLTFTSQTQLEATLQGQATGATIPSAEPSSVQICLRRYNRLDRDTVVYASQSDVGGLLSRILREICKFLEACASAQNSQRGSQAMGSIRALCLGPTYEAIEC
ncbi:hypothetical protein DFH08DRAFT_825979 [Mycena albidolilacea]|uniref:Uncharacterized protein n=1 Tax=Mycena albidolilacea TaxID=1033008 RepID=A0AAD7E9M6_9AGAR|nr:hypothetical protein DFH08DRAFT_825979 [Mycena albidolilacea]